MSRTWLKSGYGSAEIGLTAMEALLQVYLLELYVSAGLSAWMAGAALAIAVVWDAVSDPLMGYVSDRSFGNSVRKKRLGFFLFGMPLAGLAFVMLFSPQFGGEESGLFLRLLVWYLILNTAMTLMIVPYLSLINDLAESSEERAGFFGWRLGFSGGGLIVGLSVPSLIALGATEELAGLTLVENRSEAACWIAGILLVTSLVAVGSVWRAAGRVEANSGKGASEGVWTLWKRALGSRSFQLVVGAFVLIGAGRAVNASLALIFYKGTLAFSDDEVALALVGLSVTVIVATPLWVYLSRRYDKRRLCVWGSGALALLTAVVYPLMPERAVEAVVFIVVAGGVTASSVVLLESLFSDVVDDDGKREGAMLTGSYYGLWRMATKLARAGGLAVSGLFLAWIGYEEGAVQQSDAVLRSVAWAFGPGVAVFFAAGTVLIWRESKRAREMR